MVRKTVDPGDCPGQEAGEDGPRFTLLEEDPAWQAYVDDLRQRAEAGTEAAVAALADLQRRISKLAEIWELTRYR